MITNIHSSDIPFIWYLETNNHHLTRLRLHYRSLQCVIASIPPRRGLLWRRPYWTLRNTASVHQRWQYRLLQLELWHDLRGWYDWRGGVSFSELKLDYHYCRNSKSNSNDRTNYYARDCTDRQSITFPSGESGVILVLWSGAPDPELPGPSSR